MLSTLFTYLTPSIHADDAAASDTKPEEEKNEKSQPEDVEAQSADDSGKEGDDKEGEKEKEEEEEEEEDDEPEDVQPVLREQCQSSARCAPLKHHFEHCQEKVNNGQGFKGEDCVEEMFHLMHCADECAGPQLFAKIR